jgi:hypothetical protein
VCEGLETKAATAYMGTDSCEAAKEVPQHSGFGNTTLSRWCVSARAWRARRVLLLRPQGGVGTIRYSECVHIVGQDRGAKFLVLSSSDRKLNFTYLLEVNSRKLNALQMLLR